MAVATNYGWCGTTLCQARNGHNVPIRRYFAEGEVTPGENQYYYYGVDQLGSVRDVLDATTGALVQHSDYTAYGAILGAKVASATDFRFAGLFFHQPSGLYLSATRSYDPTSGHWQSRDPLGETAGYNLYAYLESVPNRFSNARVCGAG
jgi:RHS repeat-associated protein